MMPIISTVPTTNVLDSMERPIVNNDSPKGSFEESNPTPKDAKNTGALSAPEASNEEYWVAEGPQAQPSKDSGRLG